MNIRSIINQVKRGIILVINSISGSSTPSPGKLSGFVNNNNNRDNKKYDVQQCECYYTWAFHTVSNYYIL
jgi:hypothetical protein